MVSAALWEQVSALPLRDQLELADRIQAQVPYPPESVLPSTWEGLCDMLAAAEAEERAHPELVVPAREAIAQIREKYGI